MDIKGKIMTIQMTAFLKSARILRRVLETCCHSDSSEKPPVTNGAKNSHRLELSITLFIHFFHYFIWQQVSIRRPDTYISECSKQAQKELEYKSRYDWVGCMIHWELCKRLKISISTNDISTSQLRSARILRRVLTSWVKNKTKKKKQTNPNLAKWQKRNTR